ncbi:MAG: TauD/TfdA family dioxygenase, partial [Halieaceae bacterium]
MSLQVTPTDAACGAVVTGVDLTTHLDQSAIDELRAHWLKHKVLVFPRQKLSNDDLVRVSRYFGETGEDPFFGHIDENEFVCAIQR